MKKFTALLLSLVLLAALIPCAGIAEAKPKEEAKSMPFGAVFDYFNLKNSVPVGEEYIAAIQQYEKEVTSKRN